MASISKNIIGSPSQDRTYFCKSKNNLSLTTEEELKNQFNISVTLEDFKVKAFDFKANDTTETYGKGKKEIDLIVHNYYNYWFSL